MENESTSFLLFLLKIAVGSRVAFRNNISANSRPDMNPLHAAFSTNYKRDEYRLPSRSSSPSPAAVANAARPRIARAGLAARRERDNKFAKIV